MYTSAHLGTSSILESFTLFLLQTAYNRMQQNTGRQTVEWKPQKFPLWLLILLKNASSVCLLLPCVLLIPGFYKSVETLSTSQSIAQLSLHNQMRSGACCGGVGRDRSIIVGHHTTICFLSLGAILVS